MTSAKRKPTAAAIVGYLYTRKPKKGLSMRDTIRGYCDEISVQVGCSISFRLDTSMRNGSAYTYADPKFPERRQIVVGGGMIKKISKIPDLFTSKEQIKIYSKEILLAILGCFLHEGGHNQNTDMKSALIQGHRNPSTTHFFFNGLEDEKMEACVDAYEGKYHPWRISPRKVFHLMKKRLFYDPASEYKDDGTKTSFLNYFLMYVRIGPEHIAGTNDVFEKYKRDLLPYMKSFMLEKNPTRRIEISIELADWCYDNIKEFNWDEDIPMDEREKTAGSLSKSKDTGSPMESEDGGDGEAGESCPSRFRSGDSEEDGGGGEGKAATPSEDEGPSEESDSDDDTDDESALKEAISDAAEDEEVGDEIFNDYIHYGDEHQTVFAKDCFEPNGAVEDKIEETIENFEDCILGISKFLTLFKGRRRPAVESGFTSGKLNLKRAIRNEIRGGCDLRLFNRKVERGKVADVAVYLLGDNSGSMGGERSHQAFAAMTAFGQACEWSGVPSKIACFSRTNDSEDGVSYTIVQKDWDESFEKSKIYLGINDSTLVRSYSKIGEEQVPTFAGNWEEINLYYIWQELKKVDHEKKILVVLCDGCTCGSSADLENVVRSMESEDGILVIGVGICCDTVAKIYPHHKIFNSESELKDGLADYLVEILGKYAI